MSLPAAQGRQWGSNKPKLVAGNIKFNSTCLFYPFVPLVSIFGILSKVVPNVNSCKAPFVMAELSGTKTL
jgi:hypothetical protein